MPGSTLPAVKTRLVAILDGLDSTVPAYHTWPGVEQVWADRGGAGTGQGLVEVEACWLDHVTSGSSVNPTMRSGRTRREEEYEQIVNIGVQHDTATATLESVEQRAMALFALFEVALADAPNLSGTTLESGQQIILARLDEWTLESGPLEASGYAAVVAARILVRARLL